MVAIKVLRRRWSEDQQRIELFEREGKMGMTLKHPNIVEIIAVNHEKKSNQYYLVMEFVEGSTLATEIKKGPLAPETEARYGVQIAAVG